MKRSFLLSLVLFVVFFSPLLFCECIFTLIKKYSDHLATVNLEILSILHILVFAILVNINSLVSVLVFISQAQVGTTESLAASLNGVFNERI